MYIEGIDMDTYIEENQFIYIKDYLNDKIIYSRGFYNVLGYSDDNINSDFLLKNIHPDDVEIVNRISRAAYFYSLTNPINVLDNVLYISYRCKKKDGSYIKVLCKSSIDEINDEGVLLKGLTKFTNISFMDTSEVVDWTFEADNLDKEVFKNNIYKNYNDFFTKREREIIIEAAKGKTNKQISEKLFISEHTVATHRKHLYKKANKHNLNDLIIFCKKRGIL
ncbi:MAG: LuxR C-terminal-related transcriptional regulator [Flavobacteriaceae bacterium]